MDIQVEFGADRVDYDEFTVLNDVCFPGEPVSEREFGEFTAADFWHVGVSDALVGYAVLTTNEATAHIRRIGIHPDFRSRRLATRLMEAMIAKSRELRLKSIDLLVQQDNPAAIGLYRMHGFSITGESVQFAIQLFPSTNQGFSVSPIDSYLEGRNEPRLPQHVPSWVSRHNPPHSYVILFLRRDQPVGFARFSPEFPGCSHFEMFEPVDDILPLVSQLAGYALPDKTCIRITTADETAISLFRCASVTENYSLYEMTKTLR